MGSDDVALERALCRTVGLKTGSVARLCVGITDSFANSPPKPAPDPARRRLAGHCDCGLADGGNGRLAVRRRVAYPRSGLAGLEGLGFRLDGPEPQSL